MTAMVAIMMESKMYNDVYKYEVEVELAWRNYIKACEDYTVPYSKVVEYRDAYEKLLNACPCTCEVCKH